MSIHDFHVNLMSTSEECGLLTALRRLSLIEDPKAMLDDDGMADNDWILWGDAAPGQHLAAAQA